MEETPLAVVFLPIAVELIPVAPLVVLEPDEKLISEKAKTIMMSVDDIEEESEEEEE